MNILKVKEIRRERDITAAELARLSGLSKSQISEIENEKHEPSIRIACQLCKVLGITPNDLINEQLWKN